MFQKHFQLLALGASAFVAGSAVAASVEVVKNNTALAEIVIPQAAGSAEKFAAQELAEAGAAAQVGSIDELEQTMRRLIADPSELERRGRLAYEVARRSHEQGQLTLQRAIMLVEGLTRAEPGGTQSANAARPA